MPFKRSRTKRPVRRSAGVKRRRNVKKRSRGSKTVMVNRMPRSLNYPLPPRYRTSVLLDQTLVYTPVQDFGHFDILGNSIFGSYTTAGPVNNSGGPLAVTGLYTTLGMTQINDPAFSGGLSTVGFSILPWYHAIPSGLNQLMPSPYNRIKVYASKVQYKVFIDGAATSPMTIACLPWKPSFTAGVGDPPTLVADIAALPHGKYQQFVQNSTSRANTMSGYTSTAQALGLQRRAVQLDSAYSQQWDVPLGVPIGAAEDVDGNLFAWRFAYNTASTMTPAPFTINIKIRYYVELFNEATGLLLSLNGTGGPPS